MVDFRVTLNEVLGKSKKLGCLENNDFDLCCIVYRSRSFVINIITMDLTGRISSITDIARSIFPEGVSQKVIKVAHVELLDNLLKF